MHGTTSLKFRVIVFNFAVIAMGLTLHLQNSHCSDYATDTLQQTLVIIKLKTETSIESPVIQ